MIESGIIEKLAYCFKLDCEDVKKHKSGYDDTIRPKVKIRYLSHLVTTIEDLVNEKRVREFLKSAKEAENGLSRYFRVKAARLYSITLAPQQFKRKATTRHHKFGAIIFFNKDFDENQKRILIAHELGHIVNKELFCAADSENTANLFAFFAINDKNDFYLDESKKYTFAGRELHIISEIATVCPILPDK
ncbi:MAG: hypothetical protein LBK66_13465 [Spirochaetaceae bacterium]|nr:hypothetical protein [Spirochaetaceae bacterium]